MALLVWASALVPRFAVIDALSYDLMVLMLPRSEAKPKVVILETGLMDSQRVTGQWKILIDTLLSLGATRIAFAFPPRFDDFEFLSRPGYRDRIIIGSWTQNDSDRPGNHRFVGVPVEYPKALVEQLAVLSAPQEGGFARSESAFVDVAERQRALFSNAAAGSPAVSAYFVNFHAYRDGVPRLSTERLLAEGSIKELFSGKTVIVGIDEIMAGKVIPVPGRAASLSITEYHALAADTLISQRSVVFLPAVARLGLLVLTAACCLVLFSPMTMRGGVIATGLLAAALAALAGTLLWAWDIWIPLGEMLVVLSAAFLLVFRAKNIREGRMLQNLMQNVSARVQDRLAPNSFLASQDHWGDVLSLIDQTLAINRTIVLERIPGDHRLREVKALRCDISDISEKRRDYEREPYTNAISALNMIEVDNYLKESGETEQQYLTPLIYAGEILGFWAIAIKEEQATVQRGFASSVKAVAEQIASLLFQRRLYQDRLVEQATDWRRHLADAGITTFADLNQSIQFLEQRLGDFEDLFRGMSTGAALYDLWGRLIVINKQMSALLEVARVPAFGVGPVDFVKALTERPEADIKHLLNYLVIEQKPLSLTVRRNFIANRAFLLNVRPLPQSPHGGAEPSPIASPFSLLGILMELIDVTEVQVAIDLKNDVLFHLNHRLANDVASIMLAAHMLNQPDQDGDRLNHVRKLLDEGGRNTVDNLRRAREMLEKSIDPAYIGRYPIDPQPLLDLAIEHYADLIRRNNLRIEISRPDITPLAFAEREGLRSLFIAILGIVIEDSPYNGRVAIAVHDTSKWLEISFTNEGFGLPQDKIDRLIASEAAEHEHFNVVAKCWKMLEFWGAHLDIKSEIGRGMHCRLSLEDFL